MIMRRILVAEDDPPSRELVREILELEGYEVIDAADGGEALAKIKETEPDLVLLDIRMPVLSGFAVLEQIKRDQNFSHLRVIALTAYGMEDDRAKVLAAGFDAHVSKPVDAIKLTDQIKLFFDQR
jgi:two-component system cell cycle response regulator DivK